MAWLQSRRVGFADRHEAGAVLAGHLENFADEVVCALTPEPFRAVGLWYSDFSQTTDEEVRQLLRAQTTGRDVDAAQRST